MDKILDAFRELAQDERFADQYMELRRSPPESGEFGQQIRVATRGDRGIVKALEQFATARGLKSSTIEVGMTSRRRSSPGMPMVMLYLDGA
jgi:hypothetical protein